MMDAGNQRAEETAVRGTAGRADTTTGADAEGSIRHEARSDVQQGGGERIENSASVVIGVNDVTGEPDARRTMTGTAVECAPMSPPPWIVMAADQTARRRMGGTALKCTRRAARP